MLVQSTSSLETLCYHDGQDVTVTRTHELITWTARPKYNLFAIGFSPPWQLADTGLRHDTHGRSFELVNFQTNSAGSMILFSK